MPRIGDEFSFSGGLQDNDNGNKNTFDYREHPQHALLNMSGGVRSGTGNAGGPVNEDGFFQENGRLQRGSAPSAPRESADVRHVSRLTPLLIDLLFYTRTDAFVDEA